MSAPKPSENFFEYIFSWKRILWTLIINVGAIRFYISVANYNSDEWYISKICACIVTIIVTAIVVNFWIIAFSKYKSEKNEKINIGK